MRIREEVTYCDECREVIPKFKKKDKKEILEIQKEYQRLVQLPY